MDSSSEKNIKKLKEKIKSNERLAFFIGSGASDTLGIPTWKNLLTNMCSIANIEKNLIKDFLDQEKYQEAASKISQTIGDDKKFFDLLHELCTQSKDNYAALHYEIIKVINASECANIIFTTNYDNAFEIAHKMNISKKINIQKFPHFNPLEIFDDPIIIYLHGNNDEKKYVFRKEEYDKYYPTISKKKEHTSDQLESFLYYVFSSINLVFIGFSFGDWYLRDYYKDVIKRNLNNRVEHLNTFGKVYPYTEVEHFAILENDKNHISRLEDLNINLIKYDKNPITGFSQHNRVTELLVEIFREPKIAEGKASEASHEA